MDFMSVVMSLSLTFIEECHGFHVNNHVIVTDLYEECHDFMSIVMSLSQTFIEECHGFHVNSHVNVTDLY